MATAAALPEPSTRRDMPPPPSPQPLQPVPPSTARQPRRRAREVSSRYLSTPMPATPRLSTASSASSTRSRSPSPSPRPSAQRAGTPFANENQPPPPLHTGTVARRRAVQRLFDETGAPNPRASVSSASSAATPRPLPRSTSVPAASTVRRGYPRPPTPAHAGSYPSAAADDAASSCSSSDTASTVTDFPEAEGFGVAPAAPSESPTLLRSASCRGLSSQLRSSVPESTGSARADIPLCLRSLNSALSISKAAAAEKVPAAAARPPQPQRPKAAELKRTALVGCRKVAGHPEDVHQLRMMDNRLLHYRFLNARAEVAAKSKAAVAERSLCEIAQRNAGLRESNSQKRMELERMRREQRLSSIVSSQVPYMDQWTGVEGDHSNCLRGVTTALHNASVRLPIGRNVRASCTEIEEVFSSAAPLLELLDPFLETFLPKVEEIGDVASSLAEVFSVEKSMIEECGNLLYQAQILQMHESCLRSQLMQLKKTKSLSNCSKMEGES